MKIEIPIQHFVKFSDMELKIILAVMQSDRQIRQVDWQIDEETG
jgi:hypothetical protein